MVKKDKLDSTSGLLADIKVILEANRGSKTFDWAKKELIPLFNYESEKVRVSVFPNFIQVVDGDKSISAQLQKENKL